MREKDIRPKELLDRYLELSASDATELFSGVVRNSIDCVACGNAQNTPQFSKNGFEYTKCEACGTLYQSPRPDFKEFERFYVNSVSSEFWAKEFFPAVAEVRKKSVFKPRAKALYKLIASKNISIKKIIDVGAGHGFFLNEMVRQFQDVQGIAIEPSHEMANSCRKQDFLTYEALAEDVKGLNSVADLTCCLEVLEHVHDPLRFLSQLVSFTRPGGWVFFTTLGADGFDIKVLQEHANAVFPPHHLNFLSISGFEKLCNRVGLVDIEITTPGKLDVDIVKNKLEERPNVLSGQGFLKTILKDEEKSKAFQKFLAENKLSSHTWVLAKVAFGK